MTLQEATAGLIAGTVTTDDLKVQGFTADELIAVVEAIPPFTGCPCCSDEEPGADYADFNMSLSRQLALADVKVCGSCGAIHGTVETWEAAHMVYHPTMVAKATGEEIYVDLTIRSENERFHGWMDSATKNLTQVG